MQAPCPVEPDVEPNELDVPVLPDERLVEELAVPTDDVDRLDAPTLAIELPAVEEFACVDVELAEVPMAAALLIADAAASPRVAPLPADCADPVLVETWKPLPEDEFSAAVDEDDAALTPTPATVTETAPAVPACSPRDVAVELPCAGTRGDRKHPACSVSTNSELRAPGPRLPEWSDRIGLSALQRSQTSSVL